MRMRFGRVAVGLMVVSRVLCGQAIAIPAMPAADTQPQIRFTLEWPMKGVAVPRYSVLLRADGTGEYHAETVATGQAAGDPPAELRTVDRKLTFTPAAVKTAMDAVHLLRASGDCASKVKHIADTGAKTLSYRDTEGEGTCSYNYSDNKGAVQLTVMFQGIEQTLEEGRSLDFKHRFDRLGLDTEMSVLAAAVETGHAIELGNIASTLRSIAGDTELIQRVRLRAARLLEQAQAGR